MADKTVIVIPTRYESKRFPGKALVKINEKSLIEHVYRRAEKVRGVDQVVVATDDERIQGAVEEFGGRRSSPRPRTGAAPSGWPRRPSRWKRTSW